MCPWPFRIAGCVALFGALPAAAPEPLPLPCPSTRSIRFRLGPGIYKSTGLAGVLRTSFWAAAGGAAPFKKLQEIVLWTPASLVEVYTSRHAIEACPYIVAMPESRIHVCRAYPGPGCTWNPDNSQDWGPFGSRIFHVILMSPFDFVCFEGAFALGGQMRL